MAQRKIVRLEQEVIRAARLVQSTTAPLSWHERMAELDKAILALDAHLTEISDSTGEWGNNSPGTSVDAAKQLKPISGRVRRAVVNELALDAKAWNDPEHEGMTCDAIEAALGMRHTTVSSALNYLYHAGWVFDSGRTRQVRSGRWAIVWRLRPKAKETIANE